VSGWAYSGLELATKMSVEAKESRFRKPNAAEEKIERFIILEHSLGLI
jgi:hypothetical protein